MGIHQRPWSYEQPSANAESTEDRDVWAVIRRQKVLILGALVLGIASAAVASIFVPVVYESRAVIMIGQGLNAAPLEPAENLVERLKEEYRSGDQYEAGRKPPFLKDARSSKSAKSMVTLVVHGGIASEVTDFVTTLTRKVLKEHDALSAIAIGRRENYTELLNKQIDDISQQINTITKNIKDGRSKDTAAALGKGTLLEHQARLELKRFELLTEVEQLRARATRLVREPTPPVEYVNKAIYLLLGSVFGLFLGLCGAAYNDQRKRRSAEDDFVNVESPPLYSKRLKQPERVS